jgi:hypothetical protein
VDFYSSYVYDSLKQHGRKDVFMIDSFPMKGGFISDKSYSIIGKGTIRRYSWLFDFSADTVTISNGDIPLPIQPGEEVLTLKWSYKKFLGKPKVKMMLEKDGKRMKCTRTYFDTGYSGWYQLNPDTLLSTDLRLTFALIKKLWSTFTPDSIKQMYTQEQVRGAILGFEKVKVNSVSLTSVNIAVAPDYGAHNSYITGHFARRFRLMYIDKKRGQVQFIGRNPHDESMVHVNQYPYIRKHTE